MTRREDSTAAAAAALTPVGPADDDPLPDVDPTREPGRDHRRDHDTTLDAATIARVRDQARRTRPRVEQRLAAAGFLPVPAGARPGDDGQRDLDWRRDLDGRIDGDVAFLEHIDGLHEQRLRSPSARERQAATRTLAEALYRIVDGYWVDDGPPHRPVQAARRLDDRVGRAYGRLSAAGAGRGAGARLWARHRRWARLGLALAGAGLLAGGAVTWGAAAVVLRAALSLVLMVPEPAESPRRRLLGYNTQWGSCVATHVGDAAVVAGLGWALAQDGRTVSGAVTAVAALVGLTATMTRVAASSQGFRLPRLYLDRATKAVALPAAAVGAAVVGDLTRPGGLAVAVVAVASVAAVALCDLGRVVYWAVRRRRLFRRVGSTGAGPVPDVIVARTSDALVMNITRAEPRAPLFDDGAGTPCHLRAVGDGGEGGDDAVAVRPARRGRAGRRTSGRARRRASAAPGRERGRARSRRRD
jgi:hypothetical protein